LVSASQQNEDFAPRVLAAECYDIERPTQRTDKSAGMDVTGADN
jgi:hypothetical protein